LFVISAGVFRFGVLRFALAIAAGRAFRFALEGYMAARYGEQAKELFARYYPYAGGALAVAIILFVVLRNLLKRRGERTETEARG
jgi:membrane protein DedA with SNARE-associated domain